MFINRVLHKGIIILIDNTCIKRVHLNLMKATYVRSLYQSNKQHFVWFSFCSLVAAGKSKLKVLIGCYRSDCIKCHLLINLHQINSQE